MGDYQVRFRERLGGKFPWPTRLERVGLVFCNCLIKRKIMRSWAVLTFKKKNTEDCFRLVVDSDE